MTYKTSCDFDFSLTDYIGEVTIEPTILYNAIHLAYYGNVIKPWTMYYHGTPDEELCHMFNYGFHQFAKMKLTKRKK